MFIASGSMFHYSQRAAGAGFPPEEPFGFIAFFCSCCFAELIKQKY